MAPCPVARAPAPGRRPPRSCRRPSRFPMPPFCRTLAVALAAATTFILPAAAHAATVDTTGGTLHVVAAPGEANPVAVSLSGGTLTVIDAGASSRLAAATGCALPQAGR